MEALLNPSWGVLRTLGRFEASLARLGAFLGRPGSVLGLLRTIWWHVDATRRISGADESDGTGQHLPAPLSRTHPHPNRPDWVPKGGVWGGANILHAEGTPRGRRFLSDFCVCRVSLFSCGRKAAAIYVFPCFFFQPRACARHAWPSCAVNSRRSRSGRFMLILWLTPHRRPVGGLLARRARAVYVRLRQSLGLFLVSLDWTSWDASRCPHWRPLWKHLGVSWGPMSVCWAPLVPFLEASWDIVGFLYNLSDT